MRKLLLLGVAGAALALSTAASQAAVISYQILDGSIVIGSGTNPSGGSIAITGADSNFNISGNATAAPLLNSPNFSTNNFTTTATGSAGTITIRITETGLTNYSGNIQNTFTLNSLTAASTFTTGTLTNYFDASNTAFGTGTTLGTVTFTGIDSFSAQRNASVVMPGTFSETTIYTLNFKAGSASSMSSSSQLIATTTAVPEPASLALLGAGLAGIGFIRRRRQG